MKNHTVIRAILLAVAVMSVPRATWAQVELTSGHFVTSDGAELHYLEAGTGSPLVLVPGWTMPAWIWKAQIDHFAETHRVIAMDPRGQGSSDKPPFGYHHSRRAQDVGELIAHLDTDPVVLVGWSLAVLEVAKYLEEHGTDAVRAVVFVDWQMYYDDPMRFASRYVSLQTDREAWTREFVRAIFRSDQSDEYLEMVTQAALDTPTNAAAIMIGNVILQGQTDLRPFLDSLEVPALFIYSSLDWAVAAADEVRRGWPEMRVEVIDETSHALFVDRPQEFNRVLGDFLASLPE